MAIDEAVAPAPAVGSAPEGGGEELGGGGVGRATGRRRFVRAVVIAQLLVAVPYAWTLFDEWGPFNVLRKTVFEDNFYDLQARAMFHGHFWVAPGALGIEGFIHHGREYTYFGLFPSVLRMPVLLVTSSLDGKLTPMSMALAWIATGVFASMLLWRLRVLVRGDALVSRAEAVCHGALMATVMGGSVLVYLAATPFVFDEDLAWSVALTIASVFALFGVMERPSARRVWFAGICLFCANMDRLTTGWACVIGAVLIALWFRSGRGGEENRRWFLPVLAAGIVPLLSGWFVNWLKFGVLFGPPVTDQVWTHVNAYRRQFLAANHNSEVGLAFLPSTALAYLRPDGLRLTTVFPYVTLPARPASALFGVLFDRRYRTASMPASMPFLTLLAIWGTVAAFVRRSPTKIARVLLFATATAGAALLLWGYIATRYLADYVPFLAVASMVAMVDIWRRLDGRSRRRRRSAVGLALVLALVSVVVNVAMSSTPTTEWSQVQVDRYVRTQVALSDVTGHPIESNVVLGSSLPPVGPADRLMVIGACDGLYISNGEDYRTVPSQEYRRVSWIPVERGPAFRHTFTITFHHGQALHAPPVALVYADHTALDVRATRLPHGDELRVVFDVLDPRFAGPSYAVDVAPGSTHHVVVVTDNADHTVGVTMDGKPLLDGPMTGGTRGVAQVPRTPTLEGAGTMTVQDTTPTTAPALCRSLVRGK